MKTRIKQRHVLAMLVSFAMMVGTAAGGIIYVDADATGANDGSSWESAFVYLQDALAVAVDGDVIQVAQGTYKPDQGAGITPGDPNATFQLKNDVSIEGGYAGFEEVDPDARDVELYQTTLSGDLNSNDVAHVDLALMLDDSSRADNSRHVVAGSGTDSTAILAGFTITAGYAFGESYITQDLDWDNYLYDEPNLYGGGMLNQSGSPTLTDLVFDKNVAILGAGMLNDDGSSPHLTDCNFSNNVAELKGAGVFNSQASNSIFDNCRFIENLATGGNAMGWGGGMANVDNSSPVLTNCMFSGNTVKDDKFFGGAAGMGNWRGCSPVLTHCSFVSNHVVGLHKWSYGGGMGNYDNCSPILSYCLFEGNTARQVAGMDNTLLCHPQLDHCSFIGNKAIWGGTGDNTSSSGGMGNYDNSRPKLRYCTFRDNTCDRWGGGMVNHTGCHATIENCIFENNSAAMWGGGIGNYSANPTISNCKITGNVAGGGGASGGGGVHNNRSRPKFRNCIISGNTSNSGGGLSNYDNCVVTLTNCTIVDNENHGVNLIVA